MTLKCREVERASVNSYWNKSQNNSITIDYSITSEKATVWTHKQRCTYVYYKHDINISFSNITFFCEYRHIATPQQEIREKVVSLVLLPRFYSFVFIISLTVFLKLALTLPTMQLDITEGLTTLFWRPANTL